MITLPPYPEHSGGAPDAALVARRAQMTDAIVGGMFATEPMPREREIAGVRTLGFRAGAVVRGTLLHFHGGGYRLGCPDMLGEYATALAGKVDVEVVCPAYRLAPEQPFPAGLNDAWAVARALRREIDGPLLIAGDSAGGGLAASLTALLVAAGEPPDGLVLVSPWLDLTLTAASYAENAATDEAFSLAAATAGAEAYLAGVAPDDPRASPLFAAPEGFPPTFVSIGLGEVLADDGRSFVRRLVAAGIAGRLSQVPGMAHAAVTRSLAMPGAAQTFAEIAGFVDEIVSRRAAA